MKVRQGFVSNSSSSSFIVAKAVVGEEVFKKLVKLAKDSREDDDEMYYEVNGNYLYINNTNYSDTFDEGLDALNLPSDSYMSIYS